MEIKTKNETSLKNYGLATKIPFSKFKATLQKRRNEVITNLKHAEKVLRVFLESVFDSEGDQYILSPNKGMFKGAIHSGNVAAIIVNIDASNSLYPGRSSISVFTHSDGEIPETRLNDYPVNQLLEFYDNIKTRLDYYRNNNTRGPETKGKFVNKDSGTKFGPSGVVPKKDQAYRQKKWVRPKTKN